MDGFVLIAIAAGIIAIIGIVAQIARPRQQQEKVPPAPPPVTSKVTLYSNGEVVRTIRSTYGHASEGGGYAIEEGAQTYTYFAGTCVIEAIDAPETEPRKPESRVKVTLYSGGKVIRQWYAASAHGSKGGGYLQTAPDKPYIYICGTFLIEPLT